MGREEFIRDALFQPNDYIGYYVMRELAELHPDKTILEGRNWEFDLEAFVRDGQCSVIAEKSVMQHTTTHWQGIGKQSRQRIENSWLNVLWQGQLLEVVLLTWSEACRLTRHHWIVADRQKLAEEFLNAVCVRSCEVRGEILVFQDGEFQKDTELFSAIKSATFENLILSHSLKDQIQKDFKQFFNSRETYERYDIPWRRGSLFIGPPGNGKTHTVKALINQLAQPCIYARNLGYDDEDMALLFARARMVPCVMVFEDLDSMITNENRAFFLNELDGFRANTGVAVLATTNHPENLDTAILERPSRFDRKYYFNLPAEAERSAYVKKWNSELQPELRFSCETAAEVVQQTEGFSFAYLKELFVAAMTRWVAMDGEGRMDEIVLEQLEFLRQQLKGDGQKEEIKAG
jgi:AAA+ superfamily predicted ATPase